VAPGGRGCGGVLGRCFFLLWNGKTKKLAEQGAIAILINLAILVYVLVFHWPDFGF